METSHNPPSARVASWRRILLPVALLAGLGGIILFVTQQRQPAPPPLLEVHRSNLELRTGRWHLPAQTNGFTGMLLDTYDDGTLKSRSVVSNGLLEGRSEGWHTNGQPQVLEHFIAGVSHGLRTKWYPNGQKLSEVDIANGKLQGRFQRWHENGTLAEDVELSDGKPDGLSRAYYPSGFVKTEVRLSAGEIVEQKTWNDGEHME